MNSPTAFGSRIRISRRTKKLSQRDLAMLIDASPSYISKIENDRTHYPPSEEVIGLLAHHLELDADELFYLTGRVTVDDTKVISELAKTYQKQLPVLLRQIRDNPDLIKKMLNYEHPIDNSKI
jgi:transcriptional regulator with XRE-family HTH domain